MNTTNQNPLSERRFILKTYTRKELREVYAVPPKTFQRWLEPYNEIWGMKNKRYLTIEQVRKVVETFGIPGELKAR